MLAVQSHQKRKDMQISCKHWGFKPTCPINLIEILGTTSHLFTKIRRLNEGISSHVGGVVPASFGYLDTVPIEVQEVSMAEKNGGCLSPHAGFEVGVLVTGKLPLPKSIVRFKGSTDQ